jgi:hypothetical protein
MPFNTYGEETKIRHKAQPNTYFIMIHAYLIAHMLDELVDDYLEGMSE